MGSRVGLTKETDDDQEHGARRSGGGCVARIHGRYKFCKSRYRDAKKSPEDVEDGEFELLGETGLDGEHELFEDENEECIFSSETRKRAYDDDDAAENGGEIPS